MRWPRSLSAKRWQTDMVKDANERTYSVEEALSYAQTTIGYCDRMMAEYPGAELERLRTRAAAFATILQAHPRSVEHLRELILELEQRRDAEGSGWLALLSYVAAYTERLERTIS